MKVFHLTWVASAVTALTVPREATADEPSYRFVGRVNPDTKELTWPSTGVAFTFTGTSASININSISGASSVDLYIDDDEPIVISNVNGTSISTPDLAMGTHNVELRKRSETVYGTFRITDVTTDGTFGENVVPERKIEIIGDSISVGYGMDGIFPCSDSAAVQNNPKTYGAVAARALEADYSVVAWSGKGLIRNYMATPPDDVPTMPTLYTRYGANDADDTFPFPSSWVPDAVVVNLGTNDFSYLNTRPPVDPQDLSDALVKLVKSVHSRYPEAEFFFMSTPMLNDNYPTPEDAQKSTHLKMLQDSIQRLCGVKAHIVDWPAQGSEVSCDYHPTAATQAKGAALLEEAIRSELGW
jgi:lysophospholipase L1-like esterase